MAAQIKGAAKACPDQITVPKLFQESRNKKSVRIATFLRLAIVASSLIANRGTKTQVICRVKAPISLCRDRGRVRNRKKVAEMPRFLFSRWADHRNGWISQGRDHRNGANHADVRILGGSAGSNV